MRDFVKNLKSSPRDRLSYLGSVSSDMVFMGMASVVSTGGREGEKVKQGKKVSSSSSWVRFGQHPSLGGLKYSSDEMPENGSISAKAVTYGSVDTLVHIGRGSMTLASIFPNETLGETQSDKFERPDLTMENALAAVEDLSLLVNEKLMGLPVRLIKKDGIYLLDILFYKGENVHLNGYAFVPVEFGEISSSSESDLIDLLGCPRYFNCVGVVDGKLMLSFVGGFKF